MNYLNYLKPYIACSHRSETTLTSGPKKTNGIQPAEIRDIAANDRVSQLHQSIPWEKKSMTMSKLTMTEYYGNEGPKKFTENWKFFFLSVEIES